MTRTFGLACLLLGTMLLPASAAAGEYGWLSGGEEIVTTTHVGHGDLDLSRADHRVVLEERVQRAAVRLCTDGERGPLAIGLDTRRCVRNAMRNARPQLARAAERATAQQMAARAR